MLTHLLLRGMIVFREVQGMVWVQWESSEVILLYDILCASKIDENMGGVIVFIRTGHHLLRRGLRGLTGDVSQACERTSGMGLSEKACS